MEEGPPTAIETTWRRLLIDLALARNYSVWYQLTGLPTRRPPDNPVLESVLPQLLHIKATAILDEALEEFLEARAVTPKDHGFRNDLNGRIGAAASVGLLPAGHDLHSVRDRRNSLAHESATTITWDCLEADLRIIHLSLEHLGAVGPFLTYTVSGERVPKTVLRDPRAVCGFTYRLSVLEGTRVVAEITSEAEMLGVGTE